MAATSCPQPVDGLELIGPMAGSGYRTPPSLVRRARRPDRSSSPRCSTWSSRRSTAAATHDEIADAGHRDVSARRSAPHNVATLVDAKLRPLGRAPQGRRRPTPEVKKSEPAAGAAAAVRRHRPGGDRPITTPFAALFPRSWSPLVVAAFVLVTVGVLRQGSGVGAHEALTSPSCCCRLRGHRAVGRLPRVRPRRRRSLRRRHARA